MKLALLVTSLLLLLSGCSPFRLGGVHTTTEEKTTITKTTTTEVAVRHTITLVGVLSVGTVVAGVVLLFLGLTPGSKTTAWSLIFVGGACLGLSLLLSEYLQLLKYILLGALAGGGAWELVTHYAMLRKAIKDGLNGVNSPVGQPN